MPSIFLEFAFASITAVCGLAGGWFVRGMFLGRASGSSAEMRLSREALGRLQEMAAKMASDVGHHTDRVQEISDELTAVDAPQQENVLDAMAKIVCANERMQQQLADAEQRLLDQAQQIESHLAEARTDSLTGVANRRAFDDELERCRGEHERRGRAFCVLMVDIDLFKRFNDAHGHPAGDHVLRCVAKVLKQHVSKLETVARYGGEEFAVIFPDSNIATARMMAERARAAIAAAPFEFEGQKLHVTASSGLAELTAVEDLAGLIRRADSALYDSKKAGRNCGHWHDGKASHLIKPGPTVAKAEKAASLAKAAGELSAATQRDPLTGISNRTIFCEDVNRRVAERKRGGPPVSAMLVRIDNFKEHIATYGAGSGDVLLGAVTQFLKATMRDMDHVARFDEEIFSLLLPGTELDSAIHVAERLRRAIERCRLPLAGRQCQFTISIGLAEVSRNDSGERLLELASSALKTSCEAGGNVCHVFTGKQIEPVSEAAMAAV